VIRFDLGLDLLRNPPSEWCGDHPRNDSSTVRSSTGSALPWIRICAWPSLITTLSWPGDHPEPRIDLLDSAIRFRSPKFAYFPNI
jgi:hypothetical protein